MTKIKKGSQQYNLNLAKLKFLRSKGINVKLDGSWGTWQLKQYDRLKSEDKLNWFTRSMIGMAMNDLPAVMTASGWKRNKDGNWKLERTTESDKLADNLAALSWSSPTHPGTAFVERILIPGALKIFQAGKNFNYSNALGYFNPKYLTNNKWNVELIKNEILEGKQRAIDYFNSNLRKLVISNNIKEAKLLGYNNYRPALNEASSVENAKYKTVFQPHERWTGRTTGSDTEINIVSDDIKNATFHESLHNGRLASTDSQLPNESYLQYVQRVKDTTKYFEYKNKELLKPYEQIPENLREGYLYIDLPFEAAANYFELGSRLGIKPGQPYPGDEVVKRIIEYVPKTKGLEYKSGLVNFIRPDRLQNFWKALTGQYYTIPAAIIGLQAIRESSKAE